MCVSRVYSHALDELRGPAREALSVLAAKLPPAPTRVLVRTFDDSLPLGAQPADTLLVLIALEDIADSTADGLLGNMLNGAGTLPCGKLMGPPDDPDVRYLAARMAVTAWLLDRKLPPPNKRDKESEVSLARQALDAVRALPADEQRARVTALRDAEQSCAEGDRLELLTGPSGPR